MMGGTCSDSVFMKSLFFDLVSKARFENLSTSCERLFAYVCYV